MFLPDADWVGIQLVVVWLFHKDLVQLGADDSGKAGSSSTRSTGGTRSFGSDVEIKLTRGGIL